MEIIIFGFLLVIVGVGSTIIWDKHKDFIKGTVIAMLNMEKKTPPKKPHKSQFPGPFPKPAAPKPVSKPKTKRRLKPPTVKFGPHDPTAPPTEVEWVDIFEDAGINTQSPTKVDLGDLDLEQLNKVFQSQFSTTNRGPMTVQELIDHIEEMEELLKSRGE